MPIGVMMNALSVVFGGILGVLIGKYMKDEFKSALTNVFGLCALGMGINSVILMKNMPAVILSLIVGTMVGLWLCLGKRINQGVSYVVKKMNTKTDMDALITIIVLFCASSTGIYGALVSGMSGDHTILISKSILDFFTAAIFAANLGKIVSMVSIPQFVVLFELFMLSKLIYPFVTETMIADFKACGGYLLIATGLRMLKIKDFPVADMIPSMIIVMPLSAFWVSVILPLLG